MKTTNALATSPGRRVSPAAGTLVPPNATTGRLGAAQRLSRQSTLRAALPSRIRRRIESNFPLHIVLADLAELPWLALAKVPGLGRGSLAVIVRTLASVGLALRNAPEDSWWVWRNPTGAIDWHTSLAHWARRPAAAEPGAAALHAAALLEDLARTIEREHHRGDRSPWESLLVP